MTGYYFKVGLGLITIGVLVFLAFHLLGEYFKKKFINDSEDSKLKMNLKKYHKINLNIFKYFGLFHIFLGVVLVFYGVFSCCFR